MKKKNDLAHRLEVVAALQAKGKMQRLLEDLKEKSKLGKKKK